MLLALMVCLVGTTYAQESNDGIKFVENMTFEQALALAKKENKLLFIDCYTSWCGPCKMVQPELEKLAQENSSLTIAKVNVDENNNLAERFKINSIPCMILFKEGEPKKVILGYRTKQQLAALIQETE